MTLLIRIFSAACESVSLFPSAAGGKEVCRHNRSHREKSGGDKAEERRKLTGRYCCCQEDRENSCHHGALFRVYFITDKDGIPLLPPEGRKGRTGQQEPESAERPLR